MQIKAVTTKKQLKDFVEFPFQLYNGNSFWTPALKRDDLALLQADKHPFWQNAKRELFLVYEGEKILGRIAAIIDKKYNDYTGEEAGSFGFFECENNSAASSLLLDSARDWLCINKADFMRGPYNPSANYSCGLLVSGFDLQPALMMPWNPPYYAALLEQWHMRREKDLLAYLIEKDTTRLAEWLKQELEKVKQDKRFTCRSSGRNTLKKDIRIMLDIYRQSWADNWGFSPLSSAEADFLVKELTPLLDSDFFALFFYDGKPCAGMVALPDYNPLLKKLNGKIDFLLPWHYWKNRKKIKEGYRIMLFGILPQFRMMGLPMLLLDYMLNLASQKKDFKWVEGSWVLEDNAEIDSLIEDFGGKLTKRYRIYRRDIKSC